MFPKIGKLTAYGRKFYVSLMREAQQHLLAKAAKGEVFEATDFFKEPLTNIIRPIDRAGRWRAGATRLPGLGLPHRQPTGWPCDAQGKALADFGLRGGARR